LIRIKVLFLFSDCTGGRRKPTFTATGSTTTMSPNHTLHAQLEVFTQLSNPIEDLIARHEKSRRDWQPGELIDFGDDPQLQELAKLRDRARGLDPAIKVAVALNMLTEEGLPHFHRIVSEHFGALSVWERWTRLWTAEENSHGNALRDYVRDAALYHLADLDRMQFSFLAAGFEPEWAGSPYRLLAYTSLQERATQMSHANTARLAALQEPVLQRILSHLAGDESRHCAFYRDSFALALAADCDNALLELAKVAPALSMPGMTIPGYAQMAEVQRKAGIFGPREYAALVTEMLGYWRIDQQQPHTAEGRAAQGQLVELPERLLRLAERLETRRTRREFEFDFLREGVVLFAADSNAAA
jgi:acyl-[acyl-carrier-protein] desaturase